ncbi:hypothetical protein RB597_005560 [Gaeumannomyces tritici]
MGELASRIRAKFKRRASASPSIESPTGSDRHSPPAGRPRSLAGSQRPVSFAERLPSSRSNHTDNAYDDVLSSIIQDQDPSAGPRPLQQSPLPPAAAPTPAPAPAPAPQPEQQLGQEPTREGGAKEEEEEAQPATNGHSCPGAVAEAADVDGPMSNPGPELQSEPEPEPAAQQNSEAQPGPEPEQTAPVPGAPDPAAPAPAKTEAVPATDGKQPSTANININRNSFPVTDEREGAGEQDQQHQQSLPEPADGPAPMSLAPTDSAEQQQRLTGDSDCADQRAGDKMGKDLQPTLPSIHEHPQDPLTSTDSTTTTTDDDDLFLCSYPASPGTGTGSGTPTPKAPVASLSSVPRPYGPDATQALRVTAESQSYQLGLSTSPVAAARHPLIPPIAASAPDIHVGPRRLSVTSHSYATTGRPPPPIPQPAPPPAPPPAPSGLQALQLLQTLLGGGSRADESLGMNGNQLAGMPNKRKIWVRRPSASATLITINEDDVVDDLRDLILRKYANSLGRQFDSPDLTLRIIPREQQRERVLGPDEHMIRTLEAYFPGGQTVEEALIIDVPLRRTPRPSPRSGPPHLQMNAVYYGPPSEDNRPPENGTDYFGPAVVNSVTLPNGVTAHPHSISVINTGQIPQIPSPGGTRTRAYRERPDRPRLGRQHTSSPTILNLMSAQQAAQLAANANIDQAAPPPPTAPPMPTPPAADPNIQVVATPPPGAPARVASPRPIAARPKKPKKAIEHPLLPLGIFSGGVPPINVLIVEDNPINLRLLEVFVKRLKVRWQTAVNGREAVDKWRQGGFHLVLMDIQLPVMSGLDATREIRRLERVNSIGVFSSSASSAPDDVRGEPGDEDKLPNPENFKSPVIIVALTASSLQSDRHEALAAGCNDFLTKPVNFVWFEKKIMEWGCMQALIDFDGWRQWKDFAQKHLHDTESKKVASTKAKSKKSRSSTATGTSNSTL